MLLAPCHREALQQGRDERCRMAGTLITGQPSCPQGETARAASQQPAGGRVGVPHGDPTSPNRTPHCCLEREGKREAQGRREGAFTERLLCAPHCTRHWPYVIVLTRYQSPCRGCYSSHFTQEAVTVQGPHLRSSQVSTWHLRPPKEHHSTSLVGSGDSPAGCTLPTCSRHCTKIGGSKPSRKRKERHTPNRKPQFIMEIRQRGVGTYPIPISLCSVRNPPLHTAKTPPTKALSCLRPHVEDCLYPANTVLYS